jgi:hypothetical protein
MFKVFRLDGEKKLPMRTSVTKPGFPFEEIKGIKIETDKGEIITFKETEEGFQFKSSKPLSLDLGTSKVTTIRRISSD